MTSYAVLVIIGVLIGVALEELTRLAGVAVHGGVVEWRLAAVVLHVRLGAAQQQEL